MTPEEKAVLMVELRLAGMHPEWVKWFAWVQDGEYMRHRLVDMQSNHIYTNLYRQSPRALHRNYMRRNGYPDA